MVHPAEQAKRMMRRTADSPPGSATPAPGDEWAEKARRLMHAMMDNEMHAAELSGRNTYEFPRMPYQFHIDMARVIWDEIRHSEETYKHLLDLGGHMGMYPIVPGNFGYRIQLSLLHRLQDLHRRGEVGGLNGLLKSRNTFREMGDETVLADLDPVGEAAGHHVPAERTLRGAEQQNAGERRHQWARQPPAHHEINKGQGIGKADQPPPQTVEIFPQVDGFERVEAHAVIEQPVLRDVPVFFEFGGPGGV